MGGRDADVAGGAHPNENGHGTGCTLSAAIAALSPTFPIEEAVQRARAYLHGALDASALFDAVVVTLQTEAAASIETKARAQRKV